MQGRIIGHHKHSDRGAIRPGMKAHAEDRTQRTLGESRLIDARVGYDLVRLSCPGDACGKQHAEQQACEQDKMTGFFSNCHDLYYSSAISVLHCRIEIATRDS